MIGIPEMLVAMAEKAGIVVPENPSEYEADKFPHWHVYLLVQCGASMPYPSAHWDNAEVIAKIPADKLQTVTMADLLELGLAVGRSTP